MSAEELENPDPPLIYDERLFDADRSLTDRQVARFKSKLEAQGWAVTWHSQGAGKTQFRARRVWMELTEDAVAPRQASLDAEIEGPARAERPPSSG